jgi:anaerobic selenocysteine-containing dehydrogenase
MSGSDRSDEAKGVARRDFLKTASIGAGAAVGAAAVGLVAGEAVAQSRSVPDGKKQRYQESEHVKAYYRTNRF